jgi:aminoglycoside phosphotransferase (APT) family kinase protein
MPSPAPPVELPEPLVRALCRRWRVPGAPVVTARWVGATSTVHRLGDDLCVKVPHLLPEAVAACLTHASVATIARRLGVRAPEVLAVEEVDELPVPVVVSRFLRGGTVRRDRCDEVVWRSVGSQLAALHRATPASVEVELRRFTQHAEVDPGHLARRARDDGCVGSATVDEVTALRARLVGDVLPDERPVLCHGDVHTENLVVGPDRTVGLLDFAGAGWLDSAWDFAAIPRPAVAACLEGYADAGGETDRLLPRIVWCRLQLALHRLPGSPAPQSEAAQALWDATELLDLEPPP